jgi:hypothetical protein
MPRYGTRMRSDLSLAIRRIIDNDHTTFYSGIVAMSIAPHHLSNQRYPELQGGQAKSGNLGCHSAGSLAISRLSDFPLLRQRCFMGVEREGIRISLTGRHLSSSICTLWVWKEGAAYRRGAEYLKERLLACGNRSQPVIADNSLPPQRSFPRS